MVEEDREGFIQQLSLIVGIGREEIGWLVEAGFTSFESLRSARLEDISEVGGLGPLLAAKIKDFANKVGLEGEEEPLLLLCGYCGSLIIEDAE